MNKKNINGFFNFINVFLKFLPLRKKRINLSIIYYEFEIYAKIIWYEMNHD